MELIKISKYLLVLFTLGTLLIAGCSSSSENTVSDSTTTPESDSNSGSQASDSSSNDDFVDEGLTTVESEDDVEIGELI